MYLVHRYITMLLLWDGKQLKIKSTEKPPDNLQIGFTAPFKKSSTPSVTQVTFTNLSPSEISEFKKGRTIDLYAGWYNSDYSASIGGRLCGGKITSFTPKTIDGVDNTFSVNFKDGIDYDAIKAKKVAVSKKVRETASQADVDKAITRNNSKLNKDRRRFIDNHPHLTPKQKRIYDKKIIKEKNAFATSAREKYVSDKKKSNKNKKYRVKTTHKNQAFKRNTKGSTIIKGIASRYGIKIRQLKLVYDRNYRRGYTVDKKPLSAIAQVAKDCKTDMFYRSGQLYICDASKGFKTGLTITYETGLLEEPTKSDDEDDLWEVKFLMRPEISTGAIFKLKSRTESATMIVISGEHDCSDDDFSTTAECKVLSEYEKSQQSAVKKAKHSDQKAAKKDAAARKKAKDKRTKRRQAKKKGAKK